MIELAVLAAIAIAALVSVIVLLERSHRAERDAWTAERRELVNRIQAPERIPLTVPEGFTLPDDEPDDSHLVGTIQWGDPDDGEGG